MISIHGLRVLEEIEEAVIDDSDNPLEVIDRRALVPS